MFLKSLLVFVPITIVLYWCDSPPSLVFVVSCMAIVPLADQLAKSTERLAEFLGPTIGGLLNATLGNAPELIIGGLALSKGLTAVVKSSIVGSILMNLLLLLGIAMVAGGLGRQRQTFNRSAAGMSAALLTLASIGLVVPPLVHTSSPAGERELSLEISLVLFLMYVLSLVFTLVTHRQLFASHEPQADKSPEEKTGMGRVLFVLALTAVFLAVVSEIMTGALDPPIKSLGLSEPFAGGIGLASLGNVAQLIAPVPFGRTDTTD